MPMPGPQARYTAALTGGGSSYVLTLCPPPDREGKRQVKNGGVTGTEEWLCVGL